MDQSTTTTRQPAPRPARWVRFVPWLLIALALVALAWVGSTAILQHQRIADDSANAAQRPTQLSGSGAALGTVRAPDYLAGAAPVLGVVVDRNLRVIAVEAGGAAEQAGIRPGDVLTKVGGRPITSSPNAAQVFRQIARLGQTLPITLTRGSQEITLPVLPTLPTFHPGQPTPTAVPSDQQYF